MEVVHYYIHNIANYLFIFVSHSWCVLQGRNVNTDDADEEEAPDITQWEAIVWLAILTLWVSLLSGYLVDAIQVRPTVAHFPWFCETGSALSAYMDFDL